MPPPPFEVTLAGNDRSGSVAPPVPRYLEQVYWWAYVHPKAVHVFEREWLVNAILFNNYGRLRDAAPAPKPPPPLPPPRSCRPPRSLPPPRRRHPPVIYRGLPKPTILCANSVSCLHSRFCSPASAW